MHLILMTRGIQQSRDLWKKFMETQMFKFPQTPLMPDGLGGFMKDKDGNFIRAEKPLPNLVQGALRPIELWEYVFPDQSLQEVLAMQGLQNSFPLRPEVNNYAWIVRKLMGAKPIPKDVLNDIKGKKSWEITKKNVPMAGMAVYPLGIKLDQTHDFTFPNGAGFYQEGL